MPASETPADRQNGENGESSGMQQARVVLPTSQPPVIPSNSTAPLGPSAVTGAIQPPVIPSDAIAPIELPAVADAIQPPVDPSNTLMAADLQTADPLDPNYDPLLAARISAMDSEAVYDLLEAFEAADPYTFEQYAPPLPAWVTPLPTGDTGGASAVLPPAVRSTTGKRRSAHSQAEVTGGTDDGTRKRRSPRGHATGTTLQAVSEPAAAPPVPSETDGPRRRSTRGKDVPQPPEPQADTNSRGGRGTPAKLPAKKAVPPKKAAAATATKKAAPMKKAPKTKKAAQAPPKARAPRKAKA